MKKRAYILLSLVILGMLTRLMPHWPNFTAIGAVALFGGAMYRDKFSAFLVPLAALFLSDLLINNIIYAEYTEGFVWFTKGFYFIYAGFLFSVLLGKYAVNRKKPLSILAGGIASTLVFYLLTNFGSWLGVPISLYSPDLTGLMTAYAAGLPFLANQLMGTVVYSTVLFGAAWYFIPSYKIALSRGE